MLTAPMLEWVLVHGSLIAFFVLANSFFVAAEFAVISVRETRIEQLIAQGRSGARTALELKRNTAEFLPAVQFGVTLASLALGGIGEPALAAALQPVFLAIPGLPGGAAHASLYSHGAAVVLAFALITYVEVLLGELVPKSLSLQKPERIMLAVASPMDVFIRMTRPAIHLMNGSAALVLRGFRVPLRGEASVHSPEELKMLATASRESGQLPRFQEEMIHRAVELGQVATREIMTPRSRMFALPADMPLERASARIVEEEHSRVPVFDPARGRAHGEHGEHIIGAVYAKDVARLMHFRSVTLALSRDESARGASQLTLRQIMREVLVVPETKPVLELLEEFQERRRQIAIVVDEFGSTLGLVTAEDALEQLVGELHDEYDVGRNLPLPMPDGSVLLDGSAPLRDLVTQLRWSFPREAGVETLAGFLMAQLGHIPETGESLVYGGRRFTVAERAGQRVAKVRVEQQAPVAVLPGVEAAGAAGVRA